MWIITKKGLVINSDYISLLDVDGGLTVARLIGDNANRFTICYGDAVTKILAGINAGEAILDFRGDN